QDRRRRHLRNQSRLRMIHLAMPTWDAFGAGTCGKYLLAEFSKRGEVTHYAMGEEEGIRLDANVNEPLIQFSGPDLEQQTKYRGSPNVAYIFCEWEPTEKQRQNLKAFDVLLAGSEWIARMFDCTAVQQ